MKNEIENPIKLPIAQTVEFEESSKLSSDEIEVRLAIADYIIRRDCGTATGQEIFDALVRRFEGRYPHHKILSHYLMTSEYLINGDEDEYF
jgi:hypothetical protein